MNEASRPDSEHSDSEDYAAAEEGRHGEHGGHGEHGSSDMPGEPLPGELPNEQPPHAGHQQLNETDVIASDSAESSDTPPPPPEPTPPASGGFPLWAVWILALTLVAAVAAIQIWDAHASAEQAAQQATQQAGPTPSKPGLLISSRWIVANHDTNGLFGKAIASSDDEKTIKQLRTGVTEPAEKVRIAIVAGEISGGEAARQELNRIQTNHQAGDKAIQQDIALLRKIYKADDDTKSIGAWHRLRANQDEKPIKLDKASQQRLITRYGWFGKLALSYEQPMSNPLRREVMHRRATHVSGDARHDVARDLRGPHWTGAVHYGPDATRIGQDSAALSAAARLDAAVP